MFSLLKQFGQLRNVHNFGVAFDRHITDKLFFFSFFLVVRQESIKFGWVP